MTPMLAECETAARNVDLGNLVTAAGFIAGGVFAAGSIGFGVGAAVSGSPVQPRRSGLEVRCGASARGALCVGRF
jgi:hypothetical protein